MKPPVNHPQPRLYAAGLLLALAGATAPLTYAADSSAAPPPAADAPIVELDPLVITDSKSLNTTLPVRPISGIFGFDTSYQDTPRSVTQINPDQFKNDIISSYSDFARYSPSVNQQTGAIGNYGSPSMRGSLTDVYQNGVRMLVRQSNNRPFSLNAYEAADLVAGPAPVIFGPTARTSGYVNYFTKKPYFDDQHGSVTATLGKLYLDGTGFKDNENVQLDTGGPLIKDKLAYRVSYQAENIHGYQKNTGDSYQDIYGTLAWIPNSTTTADWNFEYGHFDWLPQGGYNRVTNDLIRNGTYLSGAATPIIKGAFSGSGTGFYSPVYVPGVGFNGTSFIKRSLVNGQYVAGAPLVGAPTAGQAGTVVGYVLDPSLVKPTALDPQSGLNQPGYQSYTDAFNSQVRLKKQVTGDFTLLTNGLYQYYNTDNPSNGGTYNWITDHTGELRTEGLLSKDYDVFSLPIKHDSNTGASYRFELVKNYKDKQSALLGPTGDQYDLTNPATYGRNAFFGAPVYPFSGTTTTPVLTRYGYLKGFYPYLTVPESPGNAVSPGGNNAATPWLSSTSNQTDTRTLSLFTQHRFDFKDKVFLDLGARSSYITSTIKNPLPDPALAGNADIQDSVSTWIPGYSTSLSYKPVSRITTYVSYAYVMATNGMTTGSPTWGTATGQVNEYDPTAFKSLSELREVGVKTEIIPKQLFGGVSVYEQTRELALANVPGSDPVRVIGLYRGIETNLRYQPNRAFSSGINLSYLKATSQDTAQSALNPIVADNATNITGSTAATSLQEWRLPNLPYLSGSLYASFEFASGFGVKTDLWARDGYWANNDGSVTVPASYNVNLGFFYNRPKWTLSVDFQNVTNVRNFAGGNTLLDPASVQTKYVYRW